MTTGRNNSPEFTFTNGARNLNGGRRAFSIRRRMKRVRTAYVVLCLLSLGLLADAQASRNKKPSAKPATSTNGSPTTFTLDVDQMYCDESLPYSYKSTSSTLELTIGQLQNTKDNRTQENWSGVLQKDWIGFVKRSAPSTEFVHTQNQGNTPELPADAAKFTPDFSTLLSNPVTGWATPPGGWDNPPAAWGTPQTDGWLVDNGGPLLYDPAWDLSTSTYDAQRLLVRTLFGPNPFLVACAYPYLKYQDGKATDKQLHTGAKGETIPLLTKGAGYALSLNAKDAPQYYLINIVRWQDAKPPQGAAANQALPFYQAASDDWYLLNYSDSQDRDQDISQRFRKVTPAMVSGTLRLIGSSKVMFLGIHLAPLPVLGEKGIQNPNPSSAPATEQAWFDAVSLKYTFQASAATPTNMADLNTLLSIVLDKFTKNTGTTPTTQINPAPKALQSRSIKEALNKLDDAVQKTNTALDQENKREQELEEPANALDKFLRQFDEAKLPALTLDAQVYAQTYSLSADPNATTKLLIVTQPNASPAGAEIIVTQEVRAKLMELAMSASAADAEAKAKAQTATEAKAKADAITEAKAKAKAMIEAKAQTEAQAKAEADAKAKADAVSKAITAIQKDIDSVSQMQAQINARKAAFDSLGILLSTYQGRYAAGLLTNLKNLPVTLASNWTAQFSVPAGLKEWDGNAGVYDLTKPATYADASNRGGITSSKASAKKAEADAKKANPKKAGDGKTGSTTTGGSSRRNPALVSASNNRGTESTAFAVSGAELSGSRSFGPSPSVGDLEGSDDFINDPAQDSTQSQDQSSKKASAQDSGKPGDGEKQGKSTDTKPNTTSTSTKNSTSTATTICMIGLTRGSGTDMPATAQRQSDCSDQQTKILDEGRSLWDVSVVVPVQGYQDLTFQAASSGSSGPNIVTAKNVTRENAYGVFDFYFIPEDLIDPPYLGIPHIVVGLPFAGQVFNKPYFAVGETINIPKMISKVSFLSKCPLLSNFSQKDLPLFVRPVFGWVDNKVAPIGGAPTYRSFKPQFSIEMSFSSIKNAVQTLSKNSSKNGSGNTTKPTTPSSVPDSN